MARKTHERLIEYFITVGFGAKPILNESTFWPIRDVRILTIGVNRITCVEESWSLLEYTLTGKKYSLHSSRSKSAILAFSRESSRLPITSIRFQKRSLWRAEPTWEACPTILVDPSGDEYLLVFTRDPRMPPIAEICLIKKKNESCPPPFIEQGMEVNGLRICVKLTPSCGLDCRYQTKILDRWPRQDHVGNPLLNSIASFCQPEGAQIIQMTQFKVFLPKFFTFVLTDMDGRQMYAACLRIYQKILKEDAIFAQQSLREVLRPFWQNEQQLPIIIEDESYFAPLSIALLSYYPFFEHYRDALNEIYSISVSKDGKIPIERYVANLVGETPVPDIGTTVTLRMTLKDIVFCNPARNDFPLIDVDLQVLFKSLRIEGVLDVLSLLLMEEKVVIYSEYTSLLTPVFEGLRALLLPFHWEFTYIPVLPYMCRDLLDAPFPVWIGMHRSRMHPTWFLPSKRVCVVDLDTGKITYPKRIHPPNIPSTLKTQLLVNLKKANCDNIGAFDRETMEKNELAMRLPDVVTKRTSTLFSKRGCRAAFLTFWAALLGPKLKDYLLFPEITGSSTNNLNELFSSNLYINSRPRGYRKFLSMLMLATTFHRLIEDLTLPCKPARQAVIDFFNTSLEYSVKMNQQPASWFSIPYKKGLRRLTDMLTTKIPHCLSAYHVPSVDTSNIPDGFSTKVDFSIGFPQLRDSYFNSVRKTKDASLLSAQKRGSLQRSADYFSPQKDISLLRPMLFGVPKNEFEFVKYMLLQVYTTWFLLFWITLDFRSDHDHAMKQMFRVLNQIQGATGDGRDLIPTEEIYKICLVVCGKLSRPLEAQRVFHEMKKFGVRPSFKTYGAYTSAISSSTLAPEPKRLTYKKLRPSLKKAQSASFYLSTPELMKSKSSCPESKDLITKSSVGAVRPSSAIALSEFLDQGVESSLVDNCGPSQKPIERNCEIKPRSSNCTKRKSLPIRTNSLPKNENKRINIFRTTCSLPSKKEHVCEKNNSTCEGNLNGIVDSEKTEGLQIGGEMYGKLPSDSGKSVENTVENSKSSKYRDISILNEDLDMLAENITDQRSQDKLPKVSPSVEQSSVKVNSVNKTELEAEESGEGEQRESLYHSEKLNEYSKSAKTEELDAYLATEKHSNSQVLESGTKLDWIAGETLTTPKARLQSLASQDILNVGEEEEARSQTIKIRESLKCKLGFENVIQHAASLKDSAYDQVSLLEDVTKREDITLCKKSILKPRCSAGGVTLKEGQISYLEKKWKKNNLKITLDKRALSAMTSAQSHKDFTRTTYPSCPLSSKKEEKILPEEIVKWDTVEIQLVHECSNCKERLDENSILNGHDHSASNIVKCIWCNSKFTPYMLVWYELYTNSGKGNSVERRVALWKPLVLRKEMHIAFALYRKDLFFPTDFRKKHPELFWNCLWFFWCQALPLESLVGQDFAEQVFIRCINKDPRMDYPTDDTSLRQQMNPVTDCLLAANLEGAFRVCEVHRQNSDKSWLWSKLSLWELMHELNADSQFESSEAYQVEFTKAALTLGLEDRPKPVSPIFEQIFRHPRATSRLSKFAL